MKNLFERLKPEYREKIIDYWGEDYGNLICDELKKSSCLNDLTFGTVKHIYWPNYGFFNDIDTLNLNALFYEQ